MIYQQPALFPDLTVAENIALANDRSKLWHRVDWKGRRTRGRCPTMSTSANFSSSQDFRLGCYKPSVCARSTSTNARRFLEKAWRLVETKHFNPAVNGVDWTALAHDRRDQILACTEPEVFEKEVQKLVAELKTSHTGFRHAWMRNTPARRAINATLRYLAVNGRELWMFQDLHRGVQHLPPASTALRITLRSCVGYRGFPIT